MMLFCHIVVKGNHSCHPLKMLEYKRNDQTSLKGSNQTALNKNSLQVCVFFFTHILNAK